MIERTLKQEYEVSSWERVQYTPNEDLKALEAKIAADPDNSELWMEKGLLLAGSSLYREACECYAHAIALDPFNGILYRHWAHRMLSQWRFEDACAGFTIASRLIPENWDVWYHLGLSHFLPGGGTEYVETGVELIYFILEGEMTVRTKDETIVLKKYDSIHFNVGDGKEIRNETNLPASMLVIAGMPGRG